MNYRAMGVIFRAYYFIGTPLTSTKLPSISFISIPSSCYGATLWGSAEEIIRVSIPTGGV